MIDKTIAKSNRILVKSKDKYLSEIFLGELSELYPDNEMVVCHEVDKFIETINRGSLFGGDSKIVVLWDLTDEAVKQIHVYLDYEVFDRIILIEHKTLKRLKAYQNIKASFDNMKLESPDLNGCKRWLAGHLSKNKLSTSGNVIGCLIERKGNNLSTLAKEVEKLKLLYGDKEITVSDCSKIVGSTSEFDTFKFVDNFVHKKTKPCIQEIKKLDQSQYIKIVHFLQNYVERLYKISIYRSQKKSAQDIAELVSIPKFIVMTKYFSALSVYPKIKILKLLDLLNDLDKYLRLTKFNKTTVMETYILKAGTL